MMKKTLLLLLISLIYSKIVNLTVFQLKDDEKITLSKSSGLICYTFPEKFKAKTNYFLHIEYQSSQDMIYSKVFYNLTDVSCNHLQNLSIDFDNITSEFQYSINKYKYTCNYDNEYGYSIVRREEKQKFMLILFNDFKGNKNSISINRKCPDKARIIDTIFYLVMAIFIITLCCYICVRCSGRTYSKMQ